MTDIFRRRHRKVWHSMRSDVELGRKVDNRQGAFCAATAVEIVTAGFSVFPIPLKSWKPLDYCCNSSDIWPSWLHLCHGAITASDVHVCSSLHRLRERKDDTVVNSSCSRKIGHPAESGNNYRPAGARAVPRLRQIQIAPVQGR